MADITPGIRLADTLGPLGNFPIALAENISLKDGTSLIDYINAHGGEGGVNQWVFGHGDPPADLVLTGDQRYFDQDSGRVWGPVDEPDTASAVLFVAERPKAEPRRFAVKSVKRFSA